MKDKTTLLFTIGIVAVFSAWLLSKARLPGTEPGEMRIHDFGRLPVVYQGRVKPFDTLARNALTILSDSQSFKDADEPKAADA